MSKYNAIKCVIDNITFDSQAEGRYYQTLKLMLASGDITDLEVHPTFPIEVNGKKICTYEADFMYMESGVLKVDDVKGVRTDVYSLKKKLVEALYDLKINEIRV